jgi:hypothetical protein
MIRPSSSESRSASIGPQSLGSFPPSHVAAGDEHREDFSRRILLLLIIAFSGLGATHYVDINSANPAPPYTSWASAATNIQDAIDAAVAGDDVLVTNGLYETGGRAVYGTMTNRVVVDKALLVRSVNGAQFTIIQGRQTPGTTNGPDAIRCVYLTNGASLSGFTLTNGATHDTGAFYLEQSGGGLWGTSDSVAVSNCVFSGNSASYSGGGAYQCSLHNCAVFGNSANNYGGGVYYGSLSNCTVVGNSSGSYSGGAEACDMYNSIIYFNTPYNADIYTAIIKNCCTTPIPFFEWANTAADPQLASLTHLSVTSPCRGTGSAAYASGLDIDGETWLSPPSIGCDEIKVGAVTGSLSVAIGATLTNATPGYSIGLMALITGRTAGSVWDFGDGSGVTNQPWTSHTWSALGDYPVALRAFNESFPAGVSTTVTVHVISQPIHYVSAMNANPVPPYSSWRTAATNIQDAIDAATVPGALVLVTNGSYLTGGRTVAGSSNRVALYKPLAVRSINGPEFTLINGLGSANCAYLGNGTSLSGVSLTNGNYGAWIGNVTNAAISNCVIVGNYFGVQGNYNFGGPWPDLKVWNSTIRSNLNRGASYATLNNCTIAGNAGGGTSWCDLNNCLLTGNIADVGGGAYFGTMNNCTVVGNTATQEGGGLWSTNGDIKNSIIYYNNAPSGPNWAVGGGRFGPARQDWCCSAPLSVFGIGNIADAPRFVDFAAGNLRLQSNSPCTDAGNNDFVFGVTDLDGRPRTVGGTVDIGAYEFQPGVNGQFIGWLQQYSLPTDGSADYTDPDGDDRNDWQEWQCQTIPTNALSVLRMVSATRSLNDVKVIWESVAGVNYFIERSTNLASVPPFVLLSTNIAGQASTTSYLDVGAAGASPPFYRVGVSN